VDPYQNIFPVFDVAAGDGEIFKVIDFGPVGGDDEISEAGGEFGTFAPDDQLLMGSAVGDEIFNRDKFELMFLFEFDQIRQPGH
jgi:hypothetical protein